MYQTEGVMLCRSNPSWMALGMVGELAFENGSLRSKSDE